MGRPFTQDEITFIETNLHLSAKEIGEVLGRGKGVIKVKRKELGLQAMPTVTGWSKEELDYLKETREQSADRVSRALGRSASAVTAKRNSLNLYKISHCDACGDKAISPNARWCSKHAVSSSRLKDYKSKCKRTDKPFNLTDVEFIRLLDAPCTYCGEESTGLDRVDNSKGYELSNVVPCCGVCNVMKNDMTLDAFKRKIQLIATKMGLLQ